MRTFRRLAALLVPLVLVAACSAPGPAATATAPAPSPATTADEAVAAVRAIVPIFDGIGPLDPDVIGADRWWVAEPVDAADPSLGWTVTFTVGWGDCQAGCIDRHAWSWSVLGDGSLVYIGEDGSPVDEAILAGLVGAAEGTGVAGRVTAGPTCPVERPDDPSCAPRLVAAELVVVDGAGNEVARLTSDASGYYRIALPAGSYRLEPQPVEGLMGTAATVAFTVLDGDVTPLDVAYDTGIR